MVKASILGLIRFVPLDVVLPLWGEALATAGLFAALYGVAIGITQTQTEGRAGVFEREPDGVHPRRHRHGDDCR